MWDHHTVVVRNLPYEHRWPQWAPVAAAELGMRSLLCLRLSTHEDRVGALNLFSPEPDAFDEDSVETGHAVAAHAAVAFAEANRIGHLESALVNRTVIGQATGIVMNGYGMTSAAAFAALTRLSSQSNRKLHVIAKEIVSDHDRGQQRRALAGIARMRPRTSSQHQT